MKKIINIIFIVAIILTIFSFLLFALEQPNDDIFYNKMDGIIIFVMLTPILILEIEIYNMCVYVFVEEKTRTKTFFKTFSLFTAILFLSSAVCSFYTTTNKYQIFPFFVLLVYIFLKVASLLHSNTGDGSM